MKVDLKRSAFAVIAGALALALTPPEPLPPSEWAEQNLILPDGPLANEYWDRSLALHVVEPIDSLGPDSTDNEGAVMKSAQTGFTTALIVLTGHSIDRDPCRIMIVQPTSDALSNFNREKFQPAIDASPCLRRKVRGVTSRSADGSTATSKQFPGGSVSLAIASSAAALRSKTIKKAWLDEVDEYPADLDQQGPPGEMVEARQIAFLATGDWKRLALSTPTIKTASEIERRYLAGDQRRWHVKCPGCGERFVFEFDRKCFKFNDQAPFNAYYAAPCCGEIIEGHQKNMVYQSGKYIPTATQTGAYKSWHFCAMSSPLVPWDEVARKYVDADGDPIKLKAFYNLWLGLPYEVKGDAPDHVRLMERRSPDFKQGHVPAAGLILVGAADVQVNGIYYVIKAYSHDRQSFRVDAGVLEGATDDPHGGAFLLLEELRQREYPTAFGGYRKVDAFGVDSGYRSHVVYTWTRGKPHTYALDGRDGWSKPPIGQPSRVDINFRGKRIRNGALIWPVGTWSLKGAFYTNLRKEGIAAGKDENPKGYCHFGDWLDENYFKQITSEYLTDEKNKYGRIRRVWNVRSGTENHFLDCEIYCDALAEQCGLSRLTADQWAELAKRWGAPEQSTVPDLFMNDAEKLATSAGEVEVKPVNRASLMAGLNRG